MERIVKHCRKKIFDFNIIVSILILFTIFFIIANPTKYNAVATKGILIWAKILLPSLFPFFVLSKLFASTGTLEKATKIFKPLTKFIFKSPPISAYIFLMSILTGYPVGSKLVADLYQDEQITKHQAKKIVTFTSNSGPMFILGSVGIGMYLSRQLGIIILISHIFGSILNGIIYLNLPCDLNQKNTKAKISKINFAESINSSIFSVLLIGGIICFCFVVIEVVTSSHLFILLTNTISKIGFSKTIVTAFFSGLLEITNGCLQLSTMSIPFDQLALLLTFIISFGGISTIIQAMAFLNGVVSTKFFILQKFTHALCSCFVCLVILVFI